MSPVNVSAITQGAITQTLLTSGTNAANQSVYTTASIAPAANALVTVAVLGRRSTGAQTPTITGGGMSTWTLVASVDYDPISGPLSRVSVFRALSSAPGSGTLTITYSSSQSNATWVVSQWNGVDVSGVNGAGAIVQSGSARGDAVSTLSKTLSAFGNANNVGYGVVGVSMNGPAVTPGAGFAEIAEPTSGESTLLEAEWGVNLTNVSASWTSAKNAGLLGIEIKAAGGGGGGITQTLLTSGTNATNQSVYTTASIAPAANALITVAVLSHRSSGAQTPTVTGGGMSTWTLVASVDYDLISAPLSRVTVFRSLSSAPGSGALTITYPNSQSNATWIVSQWSGVDVSGVNGAGAIGQSATARGDAVTTLSATLSAFGNSSNVAYGVVGVGLNGPAVTPGSGFTEIAEPTSGETSLLEAEWGVNLTNVSASWGSAKKAGLLGIEIKAAGGGGGGITHTLLTSGTNATNQSVYTTASIAPAANALITVAVLSHRSSGAQTPTVTGGGMSTWSLVASVDYDLISAPLSRVTVFRALSSAPGSGALTITYPNSQSNVTWIVSQWSGVDVSGVNGAGAIVQIASARGDEVSTLSKTLATFANTQDVAYGVVGAGLNGPAVTPGSGFTEIAEPTSGENNLLEAEWGVNLTNVSASFTAANNAGLLAFEIKAGGGVGGGVFATQSTVSASPISIPAGSGTSTISVTAKDAGGNPVSGATVVLAATGSGNTIVQPSGPTNASGVATGTLSSTVAETKIVSATANGIAITQTASVTVTPVAGTITHTLLTFGTNATNQMVYTTASIAPAANALITVAVLGVRSSGALTPTVTGGGMSTWTQVASVDYGPISAPLSRITVFRALSSAPGSGPLTITYSSSQSNATWIVSQWSGVEVIGVNGAGAIVQIASARGDAVSTLTKTLAAFANVNDVAFGVVGASLNGPAVTPGSGFTEIAEPTSGETTLLEAERGVNLTNVSASFTAANNAGLLAFEIKAGGGVGGGVFATQSTVTALPTSVPVGSGTSTITVTAKDAGGNPVSGATVVLAATGGGNTLTQPSGPTNASGVATGTLSSTVAETKTVSATANGIDITQTASVTFTAASGSITHTLLTSGTNATNQSVYTTASIAPAANALITVAVLSHRSSGAQTPTVTGGGMSTWTLVASVDYDLISAPLSRVTVFRALSSAPGSGALTITYPNSQSNATWIVSQWSGADVSGVNGTDAIVQSATARGDAVTTLSATLNAFGASSNVAYGVVGARLNGPAVTPGSGFTEIAEPTSGETSLLEAEWGVNLTNVSASWGSAKKAGLLGIEIKAAGGGGQPPLEPTPIDPTVATTIASATEFLYTGSNPVQTGVTPGAIDPVQAAVLRGKVLTVDGQPLPGVTITILEHPELGQTLSRADGMFDMAVNGGQSLVLNYAKAGFLPIQRTVPVPWQDYVPVDDVILTPLDAQVTTIDFSAPIQVARGSTVSDADGVRQATLLFKQGTTAEMVLPNGDTTPLTQLHVRATEYTVGPDGPTAMPGLLPPTSGYTYAAEVSVDEALAAGATSVSFSQPVAYYVENFLDVHPGFDVPLASFDRGSAVWVPEQNGRVIAIVSETGGLADIDADGDSAADSPSALAALGINAAERGQLATLYDPGMSLWRFQLDHFSPIDGNFPYGSPGANDPDLPEPESANKNSVNDPNECPGSIIECENQVLGERLPLVGTDLTLNYRSSRVTGRTAAYQIEITLSKSTVPPELIGIVLEISIAGRNFVDTFPPSPDLKETFTWDGRDAYGRMIQGSQVAHVQVHHLFETFYLVPFETAINFGLICQRVAAPIGMTPCLLPTRNGVPLASRGPSVTRTQSFDVVLGTLTDYAALGGWTLAAHHAYDPVSRMLYLGSGERQSAQHIPAGVKTIARAGVNWPKVPSVPGASGLAIGPDGSVYVADEGNHRIRRIAPDGQVTLFAGNGSGTASGDGGPALSAGMSPVDLSVGPNGVLYLADSPNNRIRRIDLDGTVRTVAGNGQCTTGSPPAEGSQATAVELCAPTRFVVGPDGSLYIADRDAVWRVGPGGLIHRVAGLGLRDGVVCSYADQTPEPCVDEISATRARLDFVHALALGPDGSLYLADIQANVIRRVTPDGIIHRFAGNGEAGGQPTLADPDGSPYLAHIQANVIRRAAADGIMHRFAGNERQVGGPSVADPKGDLTFDHVTPEALVGSTGGSGPALDDTLAGPGVMVVAPDGVLFFIDGPNSIRKVTSDGIIVTMGGNGANCLAASDPTCGEGEPPLAAPVTSPYGIALAPDGTLYYTELIGDRVRALPKPLPSFQGADYAIAAEDGSAVYEFDLQGRHLRTLDSQTSAVLASFGYDAVGRLVSVTDADNNVVTIERNGAGSPTAIVAPFGQRTTLAVNGDGYLSSVTDPAQQTVALTYHPGGLLATLTDARSNVHSYTYDGGGRLIRDDDPSGGFTTLTRTPGAFTVTRARALGHSTTYQVERLSDGTENRVTTDPAGTVTTVSYQPDGTQSRLGADSVLMQWALGPDPRFGMQAPTLRSLSVQLPSGLTSSTTAVRTASLSNPTDPLSLVSQVDSVNINGNLSVSTYTAATRRLVQTSAEGRQLFATIDAKSRAIAAQVAGLDSVRFAYDAQGQLREQQTGGRLWTYSYDAGGRLLSTLDPLGRRDSLFYDNADRLIRRVLLDGRAVLFDYDPNGNLASLTPPGRPEHGFQYTPSDLMQQYDPPGIPGPKPTRYFYNLEHQLDSIVRPDSIKIGLGYDAAGRASSVTFDRGTVTFGYAPTSGNLVWMRAPTGDSLTFSYDGSLPTEMRWVGSVNGRVGVTYSSDFRVASQTVNAANAVTFAYDRDGLLTGAGGLRLGRSAVNGLLLADTLGPVRSSHQYTSHGELKGYRVVRSGTTLFATGYARDSLGRIAQLFDTTQGTPTRWSFIYDSVGRLAADSVNGAVFHVFTYDANGNRLSFTSPNGTVNYSYDDQDRLLSAGTTTYTYGSNGELKTKTVPGVGTTTYTYDALGNLVTVLLPDGTRIDYVIDGQNRRVGRKVNGVLVQGWLYQNQLNPLAEVDGSGNVVNRFVYGSRANVPDYLIKSGVTYRLISDHLGSVRLVVDTATGVVAQRIDYDEWGNVSSNTNPGFQPFGFAGGLYEALTGVVRFGARDYDATAGRWTAKDPIGFAGGDANLYGYVVADPVNTIDEDGRILPFLVAAAFGGLVNGLIEGIGGIGCERGFFSRFAHGFATGTVATGAGLITAAYAPVALLGTVGASVFGGAVGSAAKRIIGAPSDDLTPGDVGAALAVGGATAGAVHAVGVKGDVLRSAYESVASNVAEDVTQRARGRGVGCGCQ